MNKINKKKIFYGSIFLFFLIILFLSPISGDDWGNFEVGKLGIQHSIGNAIGMYFDWEGRFISRILINILTYHKYIWNIINSLLIVLTIHFSLKIINPKNKKTTYLLTTLTILIMNIYTFSQTITWIAGNITYFFVIPLILGYFYYLLQEKKNTRGKKSLFCLVNIIVPMFVEHTALVLIAGNILLIIYRYQKNKKLDKELIIYTILSIISTLSMLLSPGSRARSITENIKFNQLNPIEKIIYNLPNFVYYTFIVNSYMLVLITFSNYIQIKKNINNKYLKILLLILILPLSIGTVILYPISNFYTTKLNFLINQNNIFVILFWMIYLILSFTLLGITSIKKKKFNMIFWPILGIVANIVMLLSPTWGYRTSLFTNILISISSLIIIDQHMKERKILLLYGFTTMIMIFYLLLYINVAKCQYNIGKAIKSQLKKNKKVIEIERFPNFINCNINPENEYHIMKFKKYYHIPDSIELKLISKNWKYLIFYTK